MFFPLRICNFFVQCGGEAQTSSVDIFAAALVIALIICRPNKSDYDAVRDKIGYKRIFPNEINDRAVSLLRLIFFWSVYIRINQIKTF